MKKNISLKVLTIAIVIFALSSCSSDNSTKKQISADIVNNPISAEGKKDVSDLPTIDFNSLEHDFGIIIQGEKVSHTFKYKNSGKGDLIISHAKASCGCTIPKYSKEPLSRGEEGFLEVIFDSNGRNGKFSKTITVRANTQPNKKILRITGEIITPKR